MAIKTALQLYTLRSLTQTDFPGIIRKVAAMGYQGVEAAGFGNSNAKDAAKLFKELGLTVVGAHSAFPVGDNKNSVLDVTEELGALYLVVAAIGPDTVKDMAAIDKLCATINESAANAKARGMKFGIHNHWWEYEKIDGKLAVDWMIEKVDPSVLFELDTYWITVAGVNAAERVRLMGKRSPILHIKDGPCEKKVPQTALGEGKMDFAAIKEAGAGNTEWWIMEADEVVGDPLEAAAKSQKFMAGMLK